MELEWKNIGARHDTACMRVQKSEINLQQPPAVKNPCPSVSIRG